MFILSLALINCIGNFCLTILRSPIYYRPHNLIIHYSVFIILRIIYIELLAFVSRHKHPMFPILYIKNDCLPLFIQ